MSLKAGAARSGVRSGFIVAGAFAKLGITIAAKPGGEANDSGAEASRDPKKIDLKLKGMDLDAKLIDSM